MKVAASKQFFNNLGELKSKDLLVDAEFVFDLAHKCQSAEEIPGFKWLKGYPNYARITLDNYRIGVKVMGNKIDFLCVLHRSVVYEQFP